jgi:putative ABC transport system permease protein
MNSHILREGVKAIYRNRLRSTLTVLGISIGIGAVICVVAIGQAGSMQIQERLNNLGDNLVWIEAGSRSPSGVRTGSHGTKTLTVADAEAILRQVPLIKTISPNVDGGTVVIYGNRNWTTFYRGVSPEYFSIKKWMFSAGTAFTGDDVERASNVCVIGDVIREQLFTNEDPVGKVLRVGGIPCQITGVLIPKGAAGFGQNQDDTIILPYSTAQKKIKGISWLNDIYGSAESLDAINPAIDQIIGILRERHRIRPGEDPDFNVRRPEEAIQAQLDSNRTFGLLLTAIASVSLLVGGIGIMNVMLVSVTERTREIGIRMAVGASETSVQMQFLMEAAILSMFGGLLGIGAGIGAAYLMGWFLSWPMVIPPQAIPVAALFSIAVGVFFGYYPARKASQLDPIEALRFE